MFSELHDKLTNKYSVVRKYVNGDLYGIPSFDTDVTKILNKHKNIKQAQNCK